ncbi:cuticle protein 16.8 [Nephila pilipes]|uniref:Cuticle protein 16.8 n=1 Tax=Nephila pilipes TaxID=299642 RepID=A0A8X6I4T2_NEPPI|nr:cuticle protein 16.8 [Nephila pilipes]
MFFHILQVFFAIFSVSLATHQEHHHPQPYKFGYEIKDHHGSQHRHEQGNGHGHVQGSYGFTDHRGIHREVHYVADHNGFRATVKTNEPGTANQDPAHVKLHSNAHHALHHHGISHHQHHHHGQQHHGHQQVYYQQQHHVHHQQHHGHHQHHGHQQVFLLLALLAIAFARPEEEETHDEAYPYEYGYKVKDQHGSQFRKEESDGQGNVKGSYGYTDEEGIFREVHYVADDKGFRAEIKTNEPGTKDQEHEHVQILSSAPDHLDELEQRSSHGSKPISFQLKGNNDKDAFGYGMHFFRRTGEHGGHE